MGGARVRTRRACSRKFVLTVLFFTLYCNMCSTLEKCQIKQYVIIIQDACGSRSLGGT